MTDFNFSSETYFARYLEAVINTYNSINEFPIEGITDEFYIIKYPNKPDETYIWYYNQNRYIQITNKPIIENDTLINFPLYGLNDNFYKATNTGKIYYWGDLRAIKYYVSKKPQINLPTRDDFPTEGVIDTVYFAQLTGLFYIWKYHVDKFDYVQIDPHAFDWDLALYLDGQDETHKIAPYAILFFTEFANDQSKPQNMREVAAEIPITHDYSKGLPIMSWYRYNISQI